MLRRGQDFWVCKTQQHDRDSPLLISVWVLIPGKYKFMTCWSFMYNRDRISVKFNASGAYQIVLSCFVALLPNLWLVFIDMLDADLLPWLPQSVDQSLLHTLSYLCMVHSYNAIRKRPNCSFSVFCWPVGYNCTVTCS